MGLGWHWTHQTGQWTGCCCRPRGQWSVSLWCQRPIAGSGQQQIAIDHIRALQNRRLASTCQCPELAPGLQYPSCLQFIAGNLCQIPDRTQELLGLHHLVARTDHRQRSLRRCGTAPSGPETHGFSTYRSPTQKKTGWNRYLKGWSCSAQGFHECSSPYEGAGPDIHGLFGRQLAAQVVPGCLAGVGHGFDEGTCLQ